jgi:hypothetical protein
MAGPRRGILLGLGFTLEALKAAGLTDAQLDAPAEAQLTAAGDTAGTGIYDVEFNMQQDRIDVTTYADYASGNAPVFVPGIRSASVRFKVPQAAVQAWRQAVFSGEPVEFNEQVGQVRLSCMVQVLEVSDDFTFDGTYTCTVRTRVTGAPTITQVTQAPPPPPKKDRGRRAMKLDGSLID